MCKISKILLKKWCSCIPETVSNFWGTMRSEQNEFGESVLIVFASVPSTYHYKFSDSIVSTARTTKLQDVNQKIIWYQSVHSNPLASYTFMTARQWTSLFPIYDHNVQNVGKLFKLDTKCEKIVRKISMELLRWYHKSSILIEYVCKDYQIKCLLLV